MRTSELIRIIGINMFQNKFKVLLTSLGIIVGTVTIVLVIAIGQGAEQKAAEQYASLSADTVYVNYSYGALNKEKNNAKVEKLTLDIVDNILSESNTLMGLYLRGDLFTACTINGKKKALAISGVTEGYDLVSRLYANAGRNLIDEDMDECKRVCVVGSKIALDNYGSANNALDKLIKIEKYTYQIVGVLEKSGDGLQGLDPDSTVLIPYNTLEQDKQFQKDMIPRAVGKVKDLGLVTLAKAEIKSSLNYYLEKSNAYWLDDAGSRIRAATESARTMKWMLLSLASIVFIVGGIGIMNVLFVTVKERTREIGVLKALGSSKSDILILFLLEASGIGIFSGAIGVALSTVLMYYMILFGKVVVPSLFGKVVAFVFAVTTSTIFGFYPAFRASRLKPVEALNQE